MLLIILSKLSITKVEKDAETTPSVAKIILLIGGYAGFYKQGGIYAVLSEKL